MISQHKNAIRSAGNELETIIIIIADVINNTTFLQALCTLMRWPFVAYKNISFVSVPFRYSTTPHSPPPADHGSPSGS